MKQWIAIVEPSQSWAPLSAADKARVLTTPGLAGLDIRIRPDAASCAQDCVDAGLPYRLHSWVGTHDGTRATIGPAAGAAAARALVTTAAGIAGIAGAPPESYSANAERDWWDHNPDAVDALRSFAEVWTGRTSVPLDYLGFALPAWHYGRVDWDGDGDIDTVIPGDVRWFFRRVLVMAYQDTFAAISATLARARKAWPAAPMGAYVSIGALRDGRVIGQPDAIKRIAVKAVAGIDEITHYLGLPEAWRRMLLGGNAKVRPLVERIPEIHAACGQGA